jgi:3-oxoacyl-[acyl-carrier-protein] synthase-1/3-oxoacyl-[acyl-carrier-protein] synthase II
MTGGPGARIAGLGVICGGASDVDGLRSLLHEGLPAFHPLTVLPANGEVAVTPVAESRLADESFLTLPRTHRLALVAARQAAGAGPSPEAIVLGTTTGGIGATEAAWRDGSVDPERYRYHGLGTVADVLARELEVRGPVITVSTACSSGAVAILIGLALVRAGIARRVLAGGADGLSLLTFHGFRALQLLDSRAAAPFDPSRAGITLGEGAAFVLLVPEEGGSEEGAISVAGGGLSCDAFHPTRPHPEGAGAASALREALRDAGWLPADVDYINAHGTGTVDNDAAEALALRAVFGARLPAVSSTKGLIGHTLGAAGAIEAVISVLALRDQYLPANTGLRTEDPALYLEPLRVGTSRPVSHVLSNSFGFGGNNACLSLRATHATTATRDSVPRLRVVSFDCLTAAGDLAATRSALAKGTSIHGLVAQQLLDDSLPAAVTRRLKRLSRLALTLALRVHSRSGRTAPPDVISFGSAWGPLAETYDFLKKLFDTNLQFGSPTDFVGSVHNSPAAQVALSLSAAGPNVACASQDRALIHALLCASLLCRVGQSALVVGAEAHHPHLGSLLEPETAGFVPSDSGAALATLRDDGPGPRVGYLGEEGGADGVQRLVARLGGDRHLATTYDLVLVDQPPGAAGVAHRVGGVPNVSVRDLVGHHASASAVAVALALAALAEGDFHDGGRSIGLPRGRVLLLSSGVRAAALELTRGLP